MKYHKVQYMNVNKINSSEIPYSVLETFGLTRNMIDDLPMDVLSNYVGAVLTCLPVSRRRKWYRKVRSRARFSLVYAQDGESDVVFHPVFLTIGKILYGCWDLTTGKRN